MSHYAGDWGEKHPAVLNYGAWAVANHILYIIIEAICTWENKIKCLIMKDQQAETPDHLHILPKS